MRAALLIVILLGGCAHPLSFTVAPTESRVIGWRPILIATLKNQSRRAIRVGSSAMGNVHVDSMICDGRKIAPVLQGSGSDCCFAGSCEAVQSREVRDHIRELQPGEGIDLPLHFIDELVEPDKPYGERWYRAPIPSRCLLRFVYGPSGFVGAARKIRSNVVVLELRSAPPRPKPATDEPQLPN